jgi:trigger factor
MQVSLENTSTLGRRLAVQVPAENLAVQYRVKLSEAAKSVKLDGFRKGHVSHSLLEQRYGLSMRQEVISKTIEDTLQQALVEHELRVAGQPTICDTNIEALIKGKALDQDLIYAASFEVYPTIDITPVADIQLMKKTANITDEDVNTQIMQLRDQLGAWVVIERAAIKGDQVKISYESLLDGEAYEEGKADDIVIELGTAKFIEGFESGLIGKAAGETVVLDLLFPADWRVEKMAGKPVQFTIQIKEVSEKQPAALNDEFAKKIHAASASMENLQQAVRQSIEKRVEQTIQVALREQIVDKILAANPFELPQALVVQEKHNLHTELHQQKGDAAEFCEHNHEDLQAKAERRVALGLLLSDVIHKENLTVDSKRVRSRIQEMAENFGNSRYIEDMYLQSKQLSQAIENAVLTEQALDCLIAKAQIESSEITVKELLQW